MTAIGAAPTGLPRHHVPDSASDLARQLSETPPGAPGRGRLRDQVIQEWLPLARHLAGRYRNRGENLDDLVQVATEGLIKAVDRYDAGRGVDFAGFAIPTVLGEIRRHFRDRTWSVRIPRRLQELQPAIIAAKAELVQTLRRSPTAADVAEHLRIAEDDVLESMESAYAYNATSLSTPIGGNDSTSVLADTLGGADHSLEIAELRVALEPAMACLDDRDRTIIALRFYGNLTQQEIATKIGVSQMHVSRLLTRALAVLRKQLTAG
jgi:RNA polymerase sigma-B factor